MTQQYYGTQRVIGLPMTRSAYLEYRGWPPVPGEYGEDSGFLVEYQDGGPGNHPDHAGYITWSPKDQFEAAYQPITAMSFGHALQAMMSGESVARAGWNGKGMFCWMEKGSMDGELLGFDGEPPALDHPSTLNGVSFGLFDLGDKGTTTRMPHFCMRSADGSTVTGWLASQTDMVARDWMIAGR